ncbi:MAG: preprotein translocase subunit SecG [Phycisphaerae bacterium]|nr:preprotein translocase subunit SecG [Phycisphaerae bacterium]
MILADLSFLATLGAIVMIAASTLLIGLVLLQKNRGSGLSGAFGGVGGHSAFGTKTGDFLTWVTVGLTAVFLLLAVLLNYAFTPARIAGTGIGGGPAANAPSAETELPDDETTGEASPEVPGSPSNAPQSPIGG